MDQVLINNTIISFYISGWALVEWNHASGISTALCIKNVLEAGFVIGIPLPKRELESVCSISLYIIWATLHHETVARKSCMRRLFLGHFFSSLFLKWHCNSPLSLPVPVPTPSCKKWLNFFLYCYALCGWRKMFWRSCRTQSISAETVAEKIFMRFIIVSSKEGELLFFIIFFFAWHIGFHYEFSSEVELAITPL